MVRTRLRMKTRERCAEETPSVAQRALEMLRRLLARVPESRRNFLRRKLSPLRAAPAHPRGAGRRKRIAVLDCGVAVAHEGLHPSNTARARR